MKVIEMTCSKCGAPLKPDLDAGKAKCEYCGHYILIEQEDTIEEIRADILSSPDVYMELKELDL